MISKDTFQFLKQLKQNNYKEWFDQNRTAYTTAKKEFETFIDKVILGIAAFDREASQTTAKASIFRINRDVRFSNNKDPYKTNIGAFMAKGGRKGINAGYYIHIEPGNCFLAGGIYMPSGPMLKAIREEIYHSIDEFREIVTHPVFVKHFGNRIGEDPVKSAPRGFPADFPEVEYLKYRSYTVLKNEADTVYQKPSFMDEVITVFHAMEPYNRFLNRAVEEVER
jgi:uncharacterized protein (TIGR02453 family)